MPAFRELIQIKQTCKEDSEMLQVLFTGEGSWDWQFLNLKQDFKGSLWSSLLSQEAGWKAHWSGLLYPCKCVWLPEQSVFFLKISLKFVKRGTIRSYDILFLPLISLTYLLEKKICVYNYIYTRMCSSPPLFMVSLSTVLVTPGQPLSEKVKRKIPEINNS